MQENTLDGFICKKNGDRNSTICVWCTVENCRVNTVNLKSIRGNSKRKKFEGLIQILQDLDLTVYSVGRWIGSEPTRSSALYKRFWPGFLSFFQKRSLFSSLLLRSSLFLYDETLTLNRSNQPKNSWIMAQTFCSVVLSINLPLKITCINWINVDLGSCSRISNGFGSIFWFKSFSTWVCLRIRWFTAVDTRCKP